MRNKYVLNKKYSQMSKSSQNSLKKKHNSVSGSSSIDLFDVIDDVSSYEKNHDRLTLGRAVTQWQFGDWESIASINITEVQEVAIRAKVALLMAAAHQQLGDVDKTKEYFNLARYLGCSREQCLQMMISGVYNILGCATSIIDKRSEHVCELFSKSIQIASPYSDAELITGMRASKLLSKDTYQDVKNAVTPEDVIILVLTCTKNVHKLDFIRSTYGNDAVNSGYRLLFLVGVPTIKIPMIDGDCLLVPCEDNYESVPLKLSLGFKYVHNAFNFKWLYKIDDDCYLNIRRITNEVMPQLSSNSRFYGGSVHSSSMKMSDTWHFGKCENSFFEKKYKYDVAPVSFAKGGYGYCLHKNTLPLIFAHEDAYKLELLKFEYSYEELRIALILSAHGIFVKQFENYLICKEIEVWSSEDFICVYDIVQLSSYYKLQSICDKLN